MCGICGFTGSSDRQIITRMLGTIVHRGPDDEGCFSSNQISLGMRRLSIIDIATGQQPVHNEDNIIWTVFNGEIYNYLELREDLLHRGHRFYTDHSDTEVIVHLYEEYGLDFVHKINGMFAIALWDDLQKRLVLYRDRVGVKPLFYSQVGNKLLFGSEIKALLTHPDQPREMDYEAIYHYFTFKNVPAPLTAFKGIRALRPGEMLLWHDNRYDLKTWWNIRFNEQEQCDEVEVRERIAALLDDATRIRMRSDVPFGAYLSGGVDSSAVVALMSRHSDRPIKTFCLGYEDELANKQADLFHARRVSAQYGTDHYEYIMSSNELTDDIDKIIRAFDQPFSGTISTYFLSKLISRHVKVALSGDGADELFGSYLTHRTAQPIWHYTRLIEKIRDNKLTEDERKLFAPCNMQFLEKLFEQSGGDEASWRSVLYLFNDMEKSALVSDRFKANCNPLVSTKSLITDNFKELTARHPLNRILEMEWKTQLPDQVLAFVDHLSMAHSVEVRSPFLDYRLIEFVSTLDGNLKIRDGVVKDVLKKAVFSLLPQGVTERAKEGFVLPVFEWMQAGLHSMCLKTLSPERLRIHGLLNMNAVQELMNRYIAGERSLEGRVWNLMMFQLWWENYIGPYHQ